MNRYGQSFYCHFALPVDVFLFFVMVSVYLITDNSYMRSYNNLKESAITQTKTCEAQNRKIRFLEEQAAEENIRLRQNEKYVQQMFVRLEGEDESMQKKVERFDERIHRVLIKSSSTEVQMDDMCKWAWKLWRWLQDMPEDKIKVKAQFIAR